jgi:hypothetical protein
MVPLGEGPAWLAVRYRTTAENPFYRAYNALKKDQARESGGAGSEAGAAGAGAVVADEPPAAPIAAEAPGSPAPRTLPNKADAALPNKANAAEWRYAEACRGTTHVEASEFGAVAVRLREESLGDAGRSPSTADRDLRHG